MRFNRGKSNPSLKQCVWNRVPLPVVEVDLYWDIFRRGCAPTELSLLEANIDLKIEVSVEWKNTMC